MPNDEFSYDAPTAVWYAKIFATEMKTTMTAYETYGTASNNAMLSPSPYVWRVISHNWYIVILERHVSVQKVQGTPDFITSFKAA